MNFVGRSTYTPTVHELSAFVASAELGSASAAALALNLTQSAVSRSIASLEQRLGVRLFMRVRQRLVLTDAGRAMLREASQILGKLDNTARMVMAFGGSESVLRLAVLPSFANHWLIPRLTAFAQRHPQIGLDLAPALSAVDFDQTPFDAALQRRQMARPGTITLELCKERLIAVASPHLVGSGMLAPDVLVEFPLIQQSTRPQLWADWLQAAALEPFQRVRGPRFEHFDMVLAAAEAGLGVGLVPDIFAADGLARGALTMPCQIAVAGASPYALIWPPAAQDRPSLRAFVDWLKATEARNMAQ